MVTKVLVAATPEGRDFSPAGLRPLTRPASRDTLSPFPGGEGLGVRGSHRYGSPATRDCPSEDLILTLYYVAKY